MQKKIILGIVSLILLIFYGNVYALESYNLGPLILYRDPAYSSFLYICPESQAIKNIALENERFLCQYYLKNNNEVLKESEILTVRTVVINRFDSLYITVFEAKSIGND